LGSNKEGSVRGEALYWMAEKLAWGYEDVKPNPVEALKLFRHSADLGWSDALIRIGQLQRSEVSDSIWPAYEAGRDQRTAEPDCWSVQVPALRCFVPKSKRMSSWDRVGSEDRGERRVECV
jgi:hypothetical protein